MSNAVENQYGLLQKSGDGDYVLEDECVATNVGEAFDAFKSLGWFDGYTKEELKDPDISPVVVNLTELFRTI